MIKYQNDQLYFECQLVSLWNAAIFYNIKVPKMGTKQYRKLCESYCCINGACLDINDEINRLGLEAKEGKYDVNWFKKNLPVELGINCRNRWHSILAIEFKNNKFLLLNYAIKRSCWLSWKQIIDRNERYYKPISYKLKGE